MVGGCKFGMDVRPRAPGHLSPREELVKICHEISAETWARLSLTADADEGPYQVNADVRHSIRSDQAGNRMHTIKAALVARLGD
jgi:ornithine carbamoyltransferase